MALALKHSGFGRLATHPHSVLANPTGPFLLVRPRKALIDVGEHAIDRRRVLDTTREMPRCVIRAEAIHSPIFVKELSGQHLKCWRRASPKEAR